MASDHRMSEKAWMSLKDIKEYLLLTMEGDSTIDQRPERFRKVRRNLLNMENDEPS